MRASFFLGASFGLTVQLLAGSAAAGCEGACGPGPAGAYPPEAAPGQCFAKAWIPAMTETYSDRVLASPERTGTRLLPPVCRLTPRSVLTRPASYRLVSVPPVYRTVTETVVVRPGGVTLRTIPPVYDSVTERVLVRPAYTAWQTKRGDAFASGWAGGYAPGAERVLPTGEIACLVQVPAAYRLETRQVLRSAGGTEQIPYPAETRVVTRQVVDQPGRTDRIDIPAEYSAVSERVCDAPVAQSYTIPAVYRDVTRTRVVAPAHEIWTPVVCRAPPPIRRAPRRAVFHPRQKPALRLRRTGYCHTTTVCAEPAARVSAAPAPPAVSPRAAPTPRAGFIGAHGNAILSLQAALAGKGYYAGAQNGLFTPDTARAMAKFQRDNRLPQGRYTAETARALGIG